MPNSFFQFKEFIVHQDNCAMKVTTDACLFGAWIAKELAAQSKTNQVLDIGCGTGLLSLMLAQKNPDCLIDAIEIDHDTAQQATNNFAVSPWYNRINVIEGDVRKTKFNKQYYVIVSNPPFYQNDLASPDLKKNQAHHDAGLLLNELLEIVVNNLRPDGIFFLLLPYRRYSEIDILLQNHGLHCLKKIAVRASPTHAFSRIMLIGDVSTDKPAINEEFSIRDTGNQYTKEFISLLEDYYLHL